MFASFDSNGDGVLDFDEFCTMVAKVEGKALTSQELRKRFEQLDSDGSGSIDMYEYIGGSILEELARQDVGNLFTAMDTDGSHFINRKEFGNAVKSILGYDVDQECIRLVFQTIDEDGNGEVDLRELTTKLSPHGIQSRKRLLSRLSAGRVQKALGSRARLSASSGMGIQQQIMELLHGNMSRVIDLFRDWDTDGDGKITSKEFRAAVAALGYEGPRAEVDALFTRMDVDGSGSMEFKEMNRALRKGAQLLLPTPVPSAMDDDDDASALEEALPEEVRVIDELEGQLRLANEAQAEMRDRQRSLEDENRRLRTIVEQSADERTRSVRQLASLARQLAVSETQAAAEVKELRDKVASLEKALGKAMSAEDSSLATEVDKLRQEKQVLKKQLAVLSGSLIVVSPPERINTGSFVRSSSMHQLTPRTPNDKLLDVESARREKAEARTRAKELSQQRIAEENREHARRMASTTAQVQIPTAASATTLVQAASSHTHAGLFTAQEEKPSLAARRRADKESKEAEIAMANREYRARLQSAGPSVDASLLF